MYTPQSQFCLRSIVSGIRNGDQPPFQEAVTFLKRALAGDSGTEFLKGYPFNSLLNEIEYWLITYPVALITSTDTTLVFTRMLAYYSQRLRSRFALCFWEW